MTRKILTLIAGAMLATSIGYAAPITDLGQGDTEIGYQHYDMNYNVTEDSLYLQHGISNKVIVGVERNNYSTGYAGSDVTDVSLHYKLDPNVRLIVGDRNYSGGPNKVFAGIGGETNLAPKLDGYASVTGSSIATEWQAGLTYKLDGQTSLQLGYKSYNEEDAATLHGIGLGINHKF